MAKMEKKDMDKPDELRTFPKGKVELITLAGIKFGRATLEPGWKWSESVKPIAKTDSCQSPHTSYHVSGRLAVKMDDGSEMVFGPGDVSHVPPGHDGWVVGNEPAVIIDITGMSQYAKGS
jgi:mannose-6-phosphate isomerase-like protein (cupin superfamily)